jgi:hypothetical protein
MRYGELFELEIYSGQVRSIDDPLVLLGPGLQIFRGMILGLIFLPLRKTFFDEKYGLIKIGITNFWFISNISSSWWNGLF